MAQNEWILPEEPELDISDPIDYVEGLQRYAARLRAIAEGEHKARVEAVDRAKLYSNDTAVVLSQRDAAVARAKVAEADNAALVNNFETMREAIAYERYQMAEEGFTSEQVNSVLGIMDDNWPDGPHPGAQVVAEVERLRRENESLVTEIEHNNLKMRNLPTMIGDPQNAADAMRFLAAWFDALYGPDDPNPIVQNDLRRFADQVDQVDADLAAAREALEPDMFWDDENPDSESYGEDDENLLRDIFDNMGDDQAEITLRCAKSLPNRKYRCWWDGDDFKFEEIAPASASEASGDSAPEGEGA